MPTYEYSCAACDTRQEVQQRMTDPTLTVCPACGAPGLRKLFTNVGVVFKGSGFYRNDSRSTSGSSSSEPAAASSPGGSESGAKGDAAKPAPAAKSESAPAKVDSAPAKPKQAAAPAAS